jgi:hypothetical protein
MGSMSQQPQQSAWLGFATALTIACTALALLSGCADGGPEFAPAADESQPTPTGSATPIDTAAGVPGTPADHGETFEGNGPSTIYDPAFPDTLTIVLFGSSGCPPEPVSYTVGKAGKVEISTAYVGESEMCTKDFSPITYTIATPPEFDPNKGVALISTPVE